MHETHRLSHDGAVDADGHILEPADLWERYLEPKYRDRALRVVKDEHGLDELEIGGKRSTMSRRGFPSTLAAMGRPDLIEMAKDPAVTYENHAPLPATDAKARLAYLDAEHVDGAIIYTTTGLLWEAELEDPELSAAYCRAYNRWVTDWCSEGEGRLFAAAHLSLLDPAGAAAELERAVAAGAVGGFVAPFSHAARPLGHPAHDVLFAAAQDLDVPLAIHPTFEPQWTKGTRMGPWEHVRELRLTASVSGADGVRHQFSTLFDYGVFDRFPRLKILVLESGGGWIGYWLDRMDAVFSHTAIGGRVPLKHEPSHYFRTQCWISCDPDERTIPAMAARYGVDRFMWASDFPHADHTPEYVLDLDELITMFPEADRRKFAGDTCRSLFKLPC